MRIVITMMAVIHVLVKLDTKVTVTKNAKSLICVAKWIVVDLMANASILFLLAINVFVTKVIGILMEWVLLMLQHQRWVEVEQVKVNVKTSMSV